MTSQEKKAYLKKYLELDREIFLLFENLSRYKDLSVKITPTLTETPLRGSLEDRLQVSVDKILEVEEQIGEKIDECVDARDEIMHQIYLVQDLQLRSLLLSKYIGGKTFEQIAEEMHYSWRHIMRLHNRALDAVMMS